MSAAAEEEAEEAVVEFRVGDLVHTDMDEEIGMVRYLPLTANGEITVEYQSQRGAGSYNEDWPAERLQLHSRPIYPEPGTKMVAMTPERIAALETVVDLFRVSRAIDDEAPTPTIVREMLAEARGEVKHG